jgi:hypothetical protein
LTLEEAKSKLQKIGGFVSPEYLNACEEGTAKSGAKFGNEWEMSGVRVLVGTRKGAFVLTPDGKRERWDVSGPHFAGREVYDLNGSPADPNRL